MNQSNNRTGLLLAATAAALFSAAPIVASAGEGKGHCTGINACKGKSSCKTAQNACKGQNSCKGHGFVVVDHATCDQLGGMFDKG